jgi:hypothetical protein
MIPLVKVFFRETRFGYSAIYSIIVAISFLVALSYDISAFVLLSHLTQTG